MKRFVYRLERVLDLRRYEASRARAELAALETERARRDARVREAESRLARARDGIARETRAGIDGRRLGLRAIGLAVGRAERAHAQIALDALDPALDAARETLRRAVGRVRSLERLRARRASDHRAAALAAEQAELEELARSHRTVAAGDGTAAAEGRA